MKKEDILVLAKYLESKGIDSITGTNEIISFKFSSKEG